MKSNNAISSLFILMEDNQGQTNKINKDKHDHLTN